MNVTLEEQIVVSYINTIEIDVDDEFNCRGHIIPLDVADLTKSIAENGLQSPPVVHEYNEQDRLRTGKNYRMVSGFRRYKALRALEYNIIPCIVKSWMPETKARISNLEENLKRKDLNILQEANAIKKLRDLGYTMQMVADQLGKSIGWVQIRFNVLDLPKDIQEECAKGTLNQNHIKELHSLPKDQMYEAVQIIVDKRIKGEKGLKVKKPISAQSCRARDKSEINKMNNLIMEHLEPSFATRCLAWAAGNISSFDLYVEIKGLVEEEGRYFNIPTSEFH